MRRYLLWTGLALLGLACLLLVTFVVNVLSTSWEVPEQRRLSTPPINECVDRVKLMAFNIAKCGLHDRLSFRTEEQVMACLTEVAGLINRERPHLVFLFEINAECGPLRVNQVDFLARRTRAHAYVFGENYRWGIPRLQLRSGNAILSRFPLEGIETMALEGSAPFYNPTGRRRALWATAA